MQERSSGLRAVPSQRQVPSAKPTSFAEFYADAHAPMTRLAYLLTGSAETAQDLTQDAFVRLHVAWTRVSDPDAYVRTSVVNACRSHHRRRFRERHANAVAAQAPAQLAADELFDALAALPYRQRAAVVLRYWHDLPEADIARELGCRPGTVGSLLSRALEQLRRVVER
jgi:RNA polymerase sigma-70 factor (sigma-E family)